MPQYLRQRAPKFKLSRDDWKFGAIDSYTAKVNLAKIWPTVVRHADEYSGSDGVHVFAFFSIWGDRKTYEPSLFLRHRVVWLTPDDQRAVEGGQFVTRMQKLLAFEEAWRERIRPNDVRHALALPNHAFEARPPLNLLWQRSAHVTSDSEEILEEVQAQTRAFREEYYRLNGDLRGRWLDEGKRIFEIPNPRDWHAHTIPASRKWKFTWPIPHGFHYDVTREGGGAFEISDEAGVKRRCAKHVNVDSLNHHRK